MDGTDKGGIVLKILSLDGGGAKAYAQALFLEQLEIKTGKPVRSLFDLIVGTSGGGLNGLAFAHPSQPKACDMVEFWKTKMGAAFRRRRFGFSGPRYDGKALKNVLSDFFGDAVLTQATAPVLVTGYDLATMRPILIDTTNQGSFVDAGLVTSAAPTYFPPADSGIDGGMHSNNPSDLAISYAMEKFKVNAKEIVLVSLGTGHYLKAIDKNKAKKWGFYGWSKRLFPIVFDGQSDISHIKSGWLLGKNYYRFDPPLVGVAMDDAGHAAQREIKKAVDDMMMFRERDFSSVVEKIC